MSHLGNPIASNIFLFVIFLFWAGSFAAANENPQMPRQPSVMDFSWEATDLDFEFFKTNVNTSLCHANETNFLACVASIQAVLQHNARGLEFIHSSWEKSVADGATVNKRFKSSQIIRHPQEENPDLAETLKKIRERRARILAWQKLFRSGLRSPINFSGVREWILSAVVDHEKAASYAAAAINGYLSARDPHAQIVPATLLRGHARAGSNRYSGIGISLQKVGTSVFVGHVIKDGPAYKVGLKTSDEVYSIDGEKVNGKEIGDVASALRGPKRTGVVVKVKRNGSTHRYLIIRGEVEAKNVSHEVITDRGLRWGYMKIQTFAAGNTCRQVRSALGELKDSKIKGLVLDLRDNMGGLVIQAACVADLFLKPKLVVLEMRPENGNESNQTVRTRARVFLKSPMVTLVNASSGSAAEILAGALQDHQRSFIAGERTFGKGSIQLTRPWASSRSIMQMYTSARYFLPSGRTIQFSGITPDFEVFQTPQTRAQDMLALREIDLFPMAFAPIGSNWSQPRAAQVEKVATCTKRMGLAKHRMDENRGAINNPDYPINYAQDILVCMYINQIQ